MDVEEFDRRYPKPADAAIDYSQHRPRARSRRRVSRIIADRAGTIEVAAALLALGGAAAVYLSSFSRSELVSRGSRPAATGVAERTAQTVPAPMPEPARAQPPIAVKREVEVAADLPRRAIGRSAQPRNPDIAEPLEGEALRAALVIDKQRTLELNAAQLDLIAERRPVSIDEHTP